jgi:hypothetical protein
MSKRIRAGNWWRDWYQAAESRPSCSNCGAQMMLDPVPRPSKTPPTEGCVRSYWRCSFCWARRAVETEVRP